MFIIIELQWIANLAKRAPIVRLTRFLLNAVLN